MYFPHQSQLTGVSMVSTLSNTPRHLSSQLFLLGNSTLSLVCTLVINNQAKPSHWQKHKPYREYA